ncbi:hypothetical protein MRX96_042445, partial [Rhipicephalus microplus]
HHFFTDEAEKVIRDRCCRERLGDGCNLCTAS